MKLLVVLFFVMGCASTPKNSPVIREANQLPVKTYQQKKAKITKVLNSHKEISQEDREVIEKTLFDALDKSKMLRERESKLILQAINLTLVEKGKFRELVLIKSELKKIYGQKYEHLEETINTLKQKIGIKPANAPLMEDLGTADLFYIPN
jgi:hypothetical protein